MSDDDRAVMQKLAALEAEVKAKADSDRARKEAALAKVKEQRAQQQSIDRDASRRAPPSGRINVERDALRSRQAELVTKKPAPAKPAAPEIDETEDDQDDDGIAGTLALAKRAHGVKQELAKTPKAGEKSWVKSGVASLLLGPAGWLYAGSLREAIPATVAWLAIGAIASKLPVFLLMPVLFVALPLSAIAGVVYAVQYNRKGSRQRLFNRKAKQKQLPGG